MAERLSKCLRSPRNTWCMGRSRQSTFQTTAKDESPKGESDRIPHICLFFYTTAIWCVEILHSKVRKFATKVASRQNSVNYHPRTEIINCVKIMICMLNCESNYTLCKIARCVKHYTMCKIAHHVKDYTQSTFFRVPCGKFYTWLKSFTQPAVVMVVTNMMCA